MSKKCDKDWLSSFTEVPIRNIQLNVDVDFSLLRSSSTPMDLALNDQCSKALQHEILMSFDGDELLTPLRVLLPELVNKHDRRNKLLLFESSFGPYCFIDIHSETRKELIRSKGVYCFYNLESFCPLYFGEAKSSFERLTNYLKVTPRKCIIGGQATSVRINQLVNNEILIGKKIGIAIHSMNESTKDEISAMEFSYITKFRQGLWNRNTRT